MRDTVPLVMKAEGVDPEQRTEQDWLDAIDKLKAAIDSGQIAASPATTTSTTWPEATSSRRSAGPATRSSSRPTTPTSSA